MFTTCVHGQPNALSGSWLPPETPTPWLHFRYSDFAKYKDPAVSFRIGTNGANSNDTPPDSHVMFALAANEGPTSLQPTNTEVPANHVSHGHLERPATNHRCGYSSSYRYSFNLVGTLNDPDKVLGKDHQTTQTHYA